MAKKFVAFILAAMIILCACSCNFSGIAETTTTPSGNNGTEPQAPNTPDGSNETDPQTPADTGDVVPSETTPESAGDNIPEDTPDAEDTTPENKPAEKPAVTTEREFSKLY